MDRDERMTVAAEEAWERHLAERHADGEHDEPVEGCPGCVADEEAQFAHPCAECGAAAGVPCGCRDW